MLRKARWLALAGVLGPVMGAAACADIVGLGSAPVFTDGAATDDVTVSSSDASDSGEPETGESSAAPRGDATIDVEAGPPGSLDPTFGDAGVVIVGGDFIGPHGLVTQANGDVVYCGAAYSTTYDTSVFLIGRLTPNGSPDTDFANSGRYTSDFVTANSFGTTFWCSAVTLLSDPGGDITIAAAGYSLDQNDTPAGASTNYGMFVTRFSDKGAADPSLSGGTGFSRVSVPDASAAAVAMVVQPDESMLLAGGMGPTPSVLPTPMLSLLSSAGNVDPTFADDGGLGLFDVLDAGGAGIISQILPRLNGYVAAAYAPGFVVLGITTGGAIDPSYGSHGLATASIGKPLEQGAIDMVINPSNGQTVCVGSTVDTVNLVGFDRQGRLDPTFGEGGLASADTTQSLTATALTLLPDGKFAVALQGANGNADAGVAAVARFTSTGALDTTFGDHGFATFSFASGYPYPEEAITSDGNGNIYLALDGVTGLVIVRINH